LAATLYLVSTPIGNLEDITLRAIRVLKEEVSVIACEDTRQTSKLLLHYDLRKPLVSYHDHNQASRTESLVAKLLDGESIALLSDAGTPLVSDPGFRLVKAAIDAGVNVVPLPGPSAALAALVASGLPCETFRFIGFLPPRHTARRKILESLLDEQATVIAYESPHRILETLADMREILGERPMALGRELTKIHEEFLRGTPHSILESLRARPVVKGEITLVIGRPAGSTAAPDVDPVAEVERLQREEGMERMAAIKAVAKKLNLPKREVYRLFENESDRRP
jgi:16S rRNA (cytidine1402-2'-O)-methyltransferase